MSPRQQIKRLADRLKRLSFKTGLAVAAVCCICYAISFGQMLLPISAAAKGVLWVVFFGLAKASQYASILILGKEGIKRLKSFFRKKTTA